MLTRFAALAMIAMLAVVAVVVATQPDTLAALPVFDKIGLAVVAATVATTVKPLAVAVLKGDTAE
jgi:conjugal transfer/entry exclusion protein